VGFCDKIMYMLKPNIDRVIIKPIHIEELTSSGIIIAGQLKAGENLLYGEIVDAGDTKFKQGQGVFYSEYSAANVFDVAEIISGGKTFSQIKEDNWVVVAQDDIMAYYDDKQVPKTTKKDSS